MTKTNIVVAGIDTAKTDSTLPSIAKTYIGGENTLHGWRRLHAELTKVGVARVGIEATGGYERGVIKYLRAAGLTVVVLQPIQVRAFARVHLRRAKKDMLDAVLIAACTAAVDQPRIEPDARLAELADHLTFVEQIEEDIARSKIQLEHTQSSIAGARHRRYRTFEDPTGG